MRYRWKLFLSTHQSVYIFIAHFHFFIVLVETQLSPNLAISVAVEGGLYLEVKKMNFSPMMLKVWSTVKIRGTRKAPRRQ